MLSNVSVGARLQKWLLDIYLHPILNLSLCPLFLSLFDQLYKLNGVSDNTVGNPMQCCCCDQTKPVRSLELQPVWLFHGNTCCCVGL